MEHVKEEYDVGDQKHIYNISSQIDDYVNLTTYGTLSWQSISLYSLDSREALEN